MIKKVKEGFRVVTHQTGKNMGTYPTKKAAEKRLEQIKRYRKDRGVA